MSMKKKFLCVLAALLVASVPHPAAAQHLIKGKASYYSNKLHGRKMSNGQIYNKDSMTCAHLRFPFGTLLKVRNLLNNKEVVVKVTDRGPYCKRYIIDLSFAAAKQLGIITSGFSPVEITPYYDTKVPFLPKDTVPKIPEINMQYFPAATYPDPAWQRDSTVVARKAPTKPKKPRAAAKPKAEKNDSLCATIEHSDSVR
ncbi:MAG: septal ring lytic transglycosylase RlpA family protein [Bacteroidaceae bacterium]|nr:septal ring lytic transglycosylase RlpA family protein [Bacteroidaceae bacterium]